MSWTVYLLRCRGGTLYCGVTTDPSRRFREHWGGLGSKYVYSRRPFDLVYREDGHTRSSALKREAAIKRMTKANKEKLVKGG